LGRELFSLELQELPIESTSVFINEASMELPERSISDISAVGCILLLSRLVVKQVEECG
jgi:hypothetical protein